jgi:predicted nucleic acid-binding protein
VTGPVVADTGPLIGLARVEQLSLLRDLYQTILVPPSVFEELQASGDRPGSGALLDAVRSNWIVRVEPEATTDLQDLRLLVDPGEAEAIVLAVQQGSRFLIIDDKKGRVVAKSRGLRIVGTGGALLVAKQRGLLPGLAPVLEQLTANDYRLSPRLRRELLRLAGEVDSKESES